MGDDQVSLGPVALLATQVNRFGANAPAPYQYAATAFPLSSGSLDPALAMAALLIYQRRATDAYAQFHDAGTATEIDLASKGFADPVAFVAPQMAHVTEVIGAFADSLGLPSSPGSAAGGGTDGMNMLLLAGGVLALWWLMEAKR